MTLTVLLFAKARDLAGAPSVDLDVADGTLIADLRQLLVGRFPQLAGLQSSLLWAVDNEYVTTGRELHDGETVACFPPVSGG